MLVGQTLGHYTIQEKLGAGGMGEVYLAEDTTLKRQVALKVLPPELAASRERLERFQREAETLAALDHPNIVTIYSIEAAGLRAGRTGPEDSGEPVRFLTMQLVEGQQLSELIPKGGMSLERIFDIATPLADALAAAHEKGVIHRDLKPANIMVTDEGRVKVLDFGLAKLRQEAAVALATELPTEPLTDEGKIVGTMPYMSPEQLEGKEIDARSDIFALGVVLYEMATGERPFKGESSASLITAIMSHSPREVDSLRAELPHHLSRIVRHCLEKNPESRFQSAKDVRNELQDLHREESLSAAVPVTPEPEPEPPKTRMRWPLVAAAVAGAAIVLIALISLWLYRSQPPTEPPTEALAEPAAAVEAKPPMIVVLPFENLGDPEDEYFADGMTEEVTSRLAVVSGLRVISRTSAMQYKGNRPALTQIGEELGVDYVLEGSVRWARNNGSSRVRITPQLIRVTDDSHLWADSYDRVIEDVFAVQSDIASKVVQQLGVTLAERERDVMGEWPTDNLNAYELYSRGREAFYEYSREGNEQAAGFFQKALELDESYVLALAGLSLSQARYITAEWSEDPIWLERAEKTALRAVALGPKSAEAHFALGFAYHAGRKHSLAQSQMNRVLELNPNHAHAHDTLADSFLFGGGLPEEAIAEYEIAIRLDPLLAPANWNLAASLLAMGRLSDASAQCQRMIQSGVAPRRAHRNIGMASELRGKYEMAVKHYSAAVEAGDVESHLLLLDLLLQSGDRGDAEAVAKALKRACPEGAGCKTYQRYLDVRLALSRENKNEARELMITPAEFDVSFSFSPFVTLSERIGIAYLEVEDYDAAIRWYQYALMVCPYWKVLHYRLGQTLEVAGQREAAIKSYRTFLGWWNRADPDAMPLLDAQERLSALTKVGPQGD